MTIWQVFWSTVALWLRWRPGWRAEPLRLQVIAVLTLLSLLRWNLNTDLDLYGVYFFGAYGMGWLAWRTRQSRIPPKGWLVMAALGVLALWVDPRLRIMTAWAVAMLLAAAPQSWLVPQQAMGWLRRAISHLSGISYSVFVVHYAVSLAVSAWVTHWWPDSWIWNALGMLLALALSVLLMMWMQPAAFGLKGKGRTAAEALAAQEEANARAQAQGTQTPVVSVSAAPPVTPAIELLDAAVLGQDWLRNQTPHHFLIQHGALPSFEKAQQMVKTYASLRNTQIVAAYRPGEKQAYFAIVSGPYDSSGPAYERIGRKDLPPNSWVRTVQSLQQQLEPSAKETR